MPPGEEEEDLPATDAPPRQTQSKETSDVSQSSFAQFLFRPQGQPDSTSSGPEAHAPHTQCPDAHS